MTSRVITSRMKEITELTPKNVLAQIWHRADDEWFQKTEAGEIEQEHTRAIVPDPLPRMKSRGENI
jgi:hypothetical protein